MPSTVMRQKSLTHTHTGNNDVSWNPGTLSSKPTPSTDSKTNYHKAYQQLTCAQPWSYAHGQHLVCVLNTCLPVSCHWRRLSYELTLSPSKCQDFVKNVNVSSREKLPSYVFCSALLPRLPPCMGCVWLVALTCNSLLHALDWLP